MPLNRPASFSAPIFVRQKTSTGPVASSRSQRASHCVFSPAATVCTLCEIVCAGPPRRPTCTYFGSCRNSWVSFSTSPGIVAEKSSVCRFAGSADMMPLHVGPEAHVEHAVRFVEHQDLETRVIHRRRAACDPSAGPAWRRRCPRRRAARTPAGPSAHRRRRRCSRRSCDRSGPAPDLRSARPARASARAPARVCAAAAAAAR